MFGWTGQEVVKLILEREEKSVIYTNKHKVDS